MSVCPSISLYSINAVVLKGHAQLLMSSNICGVRPQGISSSCSFRLSQGQSEIINHAGLSVCTTSSCPTIMGQTIRIGYPGSCNASKRDNNIQLSSSIVPSRTHHAISLACQSMNMRLLVPKPKLLPKVRSTVGAMSWPRGRASAGFLFGLLVCNSSSEPSNADAVSENGNKRDDDCNEPCVKFSHGKKVYTDYYVIGIPGDGRCLFRAVAHGACLRSGKPPSTERIQRQLADELRGQVADEFINRRKETEWFVEGDFDSYVSHIRKPHVWGGEPELFIASHVLQVPITVYIYDQDAGGLISIAEYGQEYGSENPIRVLYHGFGHYDALEIPTRKGSRPRPRPRLRL